MMTIPTETLIPPANKAPTDETRLTVLDCILDGHSITETATRTSVHRTDVEAITGLAGWPNTAWMTAARDRIATALTQPVVVKVKPPVKSESRARSAAEQAAERAAHQQAVLTRHGVTRADIATWAHDNGHVALRSGFLPRATLDAFEASR